MSAIKYSNGKMKLGGLGLGLSPNYSEGADVGIEHTGEGFGGLLDYGTQYSRPVSKTDFLRRDEVKLGTKDNNLNYKGDSEGNYKYSANLKPIDGLGLGLSREGSKRYNKDSIEAAIQLADIQARGMYSEDSGGERSYGTKLSYDDKYAIEVVRRQKEREHNDKIKATYFNGGFRTSLGYDRGHKGDYNLSADMKYTF